MNYHFVIEKNSRGRQNAFSRGYDKPKLDISASLLSCIPPVLHPPLSVSPPVQHTRTSCSPTVIHSSCPVSLQWSCIPQCVCILRQTVCLGGGKAIYGITCLQNACAYWDWKSAWGGIHGTSVADPEWFIPDPDPAFNFPSSGSGSNLYYLIFKYI